MTVKVRPMFDKVLVEVDQETTSPGGIILPASDPNEKQQRGRVIAVGEGRRENGHRIPPQVKPGDKVLFDRWSTVEIKIDGQSVFIAVEDGIIGILDGDLE